MTLGRALVEVVGRLLLAHMFLISGFSKIGGFANLFYIRGIQEKFHCCVLT